ncbi:hypothetical protein Gorai_015757 [Gossypium raimondii]|uniref:RNase H type-1 domain-containing protein n=1 Tax=Gossypium raimondii TaxID=29730 RepID=A0A7J8P706_GOSRA|nr:hypothetical protein [Gossypium raimondii]
MGSEFDGICLEGHCVQCGYLMETSLHALRDCDHWGKAEKGWVKLNIDGAFSKSINIAVIGGVFRDHDGIGKCGFTMRIEKDSVFRTEVRAILEGLNLASTFGFRQLELECDNVLVVENILVDGVGANMLFELRLIKQLLCRDWKVCLRHIPSEHNKIANSMAKFGKWNL